MQNRRYLNKYDKVGVTGCRELPACNGQDEVTCDGGSCVYRSPCSALTSVCCVSRARTFTCKHTFTVRFFVWRMPTCHNGLFYTDEGDTSAGTGKLCILGHLGLVFIWSCFVSCLLFLLFYVSLRNLCSGTCRKIR